VLLNGVSLLKVWHNPEICLETMKDVTKTHQVCQLVHHVKMKASFYLSAIYIMQVKGLFTSVRNILGCAIAKAVSSFPPERRGFESRSDNVGFVEDKAALGQDSSSIIWGWYNRPNSGRPTKWTQSHPTPRKKKKKKRKTALP
jgi:hypothetical protein